METTLYLIRHGQTEWNTQQKMQGWKNSALTKEGKKQAILLGEELKARSISLAYFYSSPSQRALETRALINDSLNVPVREEFGLQEINMGNWEGKTYEEIEAAYLDEWNHFWYNPTAFKAENKGETFADLSRRSSKSIQHIVTSHEGQEIGIVSHRITIKIMVADLLGISINELEDVEPNSVTKITFANGTPRLDFYSDISHYADKKE